MTHLLLLTLLQATADFTSYGELKVLGWTKDSRYFLVTGVMDTPGGQAIYDTVEDELADLPDEDQAFEKWQASHPLAPVDSGREGLGGKVKADVKVQQSTGGAWNGKSYVPKGASGTQLTVEREGHVYVSFSWSGGVHTVKPYWSPDGRRVAWVVHPRDWSGPDTTTGYQVLIGPAGLPRVHVVGGKALLPKVAPQVRAQLDQKGFVTTYVGKAMKERDASVVYAAAGMEDLAKQAAALVPGGATVDKLTWKAQAELVVALGSKALGGGK